MNNSVQIIDNKNVSLNIDNLKIDNLKIDNSKNLIINIENIYVKKVEVGKYAIFEVIENIKSIIELNSSNVFIKTIYNEILWLRNKKIFKIEIENKIIDVWFCKIISYDDLVKECNLTTEEKDFFSSNNKTQSIDTNSVKMIYGRCQNSMEFLDKTHRTYVSKMKFQKNEIIAIKSVAGSGKTTTLLELAKAHKNKKILYIAFNKSLIIEIKDKIKSQKIDNLFPQTFDALMRGVFVSKNKFDPDIVDLKPQNIQNYVEWFNNKPYRMKKSYTQIISKFCAQTQFDNIVDFCIKNYGAEKKLINILWEKIQKMELITFDSIRKMAQMKHWCKDYIDNCFDMIFIDESQDFDNIMLKILLDDTTIPKLFVGDPKQAIYEWKGCINAFEKLPKETIMIEFYSTFRVGEPACSQIRDKFDNCWMISKSSNITDLESSSNYEIQLNDKYVYLFRNWKSLLQTAQNTAKVWIYNYESQIEYIKKLHAKLSVSKLSEDDMNEFADDLPMFLLKITKEDLERLIDGINKNICPKETCMVEMYTIHSYKGLESNIIRIFNDIDIKNESNLYYVALTRGMKKIVVDKPIESISNIMQLKVDKNIKTKKVREEIIINEFENLNMMIDNVKSMEFFMSNVKTQVIETVVETQVIETIVEKVETPVIQTIVETPVIQTIVETPVIETVVETPVIETVVETPVIETVVETPVIETVVETPVIETIVETPVIETPVIETVVETPVIETIVEKVETPVIQTIVETPVIETIVEKVETPVIQTIVETPVIETIVEKVETPVIETIVEKVETPVIETIVEKVEAHVIEIPKEVFIIESKKEIIIEPKKEIIIEVPKEVLIIEPLNKTVKKDERHNLPTTVKHEEIKKEEVQKNKKELTDKITLNMFLSGLKIDEIAKNRSIKESTIVEHIIKNIEHPQITWNKFMNETEYMQIKKAFELMGINVSLKQIKGYVSKDISNDKISIVKELLSKKKY
jgi:hypothetical protein